MTNGLFLRRIILLAVCSLPFFLGTTWAQTETVLYSFCPHKLCPDGLSPDAPLVLDQHGNMFGTTWQGGTHRLCEGVGCGVIFKVTPSGKQTVLYNFCAQDNCTDGGDPQAGVVFDQEGNLYGTTFFGGIQSDLCDPLEGEGCGVVFKLTPEGKYTVLYRFCAQSQCEDGADPSAGLVFDRKGNLYGTTKYGGTYRGGTVFKLAPGGKQTVLYNFCAQTDCADGFYPAAGLVFDKKGTLYGTTPNGGYLDCFAPLGCGVAFELTPKGKYKVLHTFCTGNCSDGGVPAPGVIVDDEGNVYGTTNYGECGYCEGGTVFKISPEGKETVLYNFCEQNGCPDGATPKEIIFHDGKNLYGTTQYGGGLGCCGVVFKLTPEGKETVLHSFCGPKGCPDGSLPIAGVTFDQQGNMFGTTTQGGAYNGGTVFKITP